jgi:transcriptional regulator with XRE-family HTH domain
MSKLRAWRQAKDMTQSELAVRLGCSTPSVCKIEAGEQLPSPDLMLKIQQVTRSAVTIADIVGEHTTQPRKKRRPSALAAAV